MATIVNKLENITYSASKEKQEDALKDFFTIPLGHMIRNTHQIVEWVHDGFVTTVYKEEKNRHKRSASLCLQSRQEPKQEEKATFQSPSLIFQTMNEARKSMIRNLKDQLQMMQLEIDALNVIKEFDKRLQEWKKDPTNVENLKFLRDFCWDRLNVLLEGPIIGYLGWLLCYNRLTILLQREQKAFGISSFHSLVKEYEKRTKECIFNMSILLRILSALECVKEGKQDPVFAAMALLLSLQEIAIKNNAKKDEQQAEISNINLKIQTDNYSKMEKSLKQIEAAEAKSWWMSFVNIIVTGIAAICLAFTGQFAMAAVIVAFTLMSSVLDKAATALAKGFEKIGLGKKIAKFLADLIITIAVVVATLGTASAGAYCCRLITMAEEAAELSIKSYIRCALLSMTQSFISVNFAQDFSNVCCNKDSKGNVALTIILAAILQLLTLCLTLGSGFPADTSTRLFAAAQKTQLVCMLGQAGIHFWMGINKIHFGGAQYKFSTCQGVLDLADSMEQVNQKQIQLTQEELKKLIKEQRQIAKTMLALASMEMGQVRVLEQTA